MVPLHVVHSAPLYFAIDRYPVADGLPIHRFKVGRAHINFHYAQLPHKQLTMCSSYYIINADDLLTQESPAASVAQAPTHNSLPPSSYILHHLTRPYQEEASAHASLHCSTRYNVDIPLAQRMLVQELLPIPLHCICYVRFMNRMNHGSNVTYIYSILFLEAGMILQQVLPSFSKCARFYCHHHRY